MLSREDGEASQNRGFRDFVLLTGFRGEQIERHFIDGSRLGLQIAYSHEDQPLGTGGAVRDARAMLGDRFVLTYGDVYRRFDYDRFVTAHQGPAVAAYERIRSGNLAIDGDRVVRFDKRAPELPYVDAGFCVMPSSTIDLIPATGAASFEESVFPRLAADGRLTCEILDHNFYEIGTLEQLERTREALS